MKSTLCWYCTNPGTGRCSWDESLTPVPGWTAEPSKTDGFDTFKVIACPLFVRQRGRSIPVSKFVRLINAQSTIPSGEEAAR